MRRIWIVLLLLWPATALAQVDLSVDLRTDYLPQLDFDFARVSLVSLGGPSEPGLFRDVLRTGSVEAR